MNNMLKLLCSVVLIFTTSGVFSAGGINSNKITKVEFQSDHFLSVLMGGVIQTLVSKAMRWF